MYVRAALLVNTFQPVYIIQRAIFHNKVRVVFVYNRCTLIHRMFEKIWEGKWLLEFKTE